MPPSRPPTDQGGINTGNTRAPSQRPLGVPPAVVSPIHEAHPRTHLSPPALTHSTSSSASTAASKSASKLVKAAQGQWSTAETRLGCLLAITTAVYIHEYEIFTEELTYPLYIKNRQCIDRVTKIETRKRTRIGRAAFEPSYVGWISSLSANRFEEEDAYDIKEFLPTLIFHWQDHENANARVGCREAEVRAGVDAMIKLAFEYRDGSKHTHRLETDLFLPGKPWLAKADNVCMIDLPAEWIAFLLRLPNRHIFCADESTFAVVTFVCEAKIKEFVHAARQLTLDLCSAQHQRRALGFEDSKIFGATLVNTEMCFFVSEWEGNTVHVTPTNKRFDLKTFQQFLSCYIFLCKLADLEASNVQSVLDLWMPGKDSQKIKDRNTMESQKESWRQFSPPSASDSKKRRHDDEEEGDDMESVYSRDQEQFEDEAGNYSAEVCTDDEGKILPGGLALSRQNLRALEYLSREKRIPGPPEIDEWARSSGFGCDGVV